MAKTIFEEMGGRYERQGDYILPCLTVPPEEEKPIGVFGQRHLRYLREYSKVTYTTFSQAAGLMPTLRRLTSRRRNALGGS